MDTGTLGRTDLRVTRLGIGTWAMGGGGWCLSAGPQNDDESVAAIRRAVELGVNWIDTAPLYGLGHAEEIVGRALRQLGSRPLIFTKCGYIWDEYGNVSQTLRANSVRREVESSLQRLGIDVIDLVQIHQPSPVEEIEEGWETLVRLKQEGKIRYAGVSNFSVEQMKRLQAIALITSLQCFYSLAHRYSFESCLEFSVQQNIGMLAFSTMASGLFSGRMTRERVAALPEDDSRRTYDHFKEPQLSFNLALAEVLRRIGQRHGRSTAEIAIAWVLRNPAVSSAIIGVRSTHQVESMLGAVSVSLDDGDIAKIETLLAARRVQAHAGVSRLQLAIRRLLGKAAL